MRNFSVIVAMLLLSTNAWAQQAVNGFALERFVPSAPGGAWLVMDSLEMHGGLGGAASLNTSYARLPLRVGSGAAPLAVVSDEAVANIGAAITYDRFRLSLNIASPLSIQGQSGTVGDYVYTAPSVDFGSHPDTITDIRFGFDARIFGEPGSAFRFGAGAQLYVPNGSRDDYDTDGTFRGMGRLLFAGDIPLGGISSFTYAGHLGVHIRPLDESPMPGAARGHELLYGVAAGMSFLARPGLAIVFGPEVFGASALRHFADPTSTALEGLLSGRIETTGERGMQWRVKLGVGAGLLPSLGAPAWRIVLAVEVFGRTGWLRPVPASQPSSD